MDKNVSNIDVPAAKEAREDMTQQRVNALFHFLEKSFAPAISLIPRPMRTELQEEYDRLKELMTDGDA